MFVFVTAKNCIFKYVFLMFVVLVLCIVAYVFSLIIVRSVYYNLCEKISNKKGIIIICKESKICCQWALYNVLSVYLQYDRNRLIHLSSVHFSSK